MTDTRDSHVQGLTALRNAEDWAKEVRDTVIARANERAGQMPADEEEEETEDGEAEDEEEEAEDEEEETDDKEVEAESSNTMPSYAHRTETTHSSLIDGKDSDMYESDTSTDELQRDTDYHPPAKRAKVK